MVKTRAVFISKVQRLLKYVQKGAYHRGTVLMLLAMFLSTWVLPPTRAYMVAENSIIQSLPDAQALVQQGTTLYSAERFNDAAKVFQQAADAFKATGDGLRQAMTLSNVSLAYQQLGQWPQARQALAQGLKLLQSRQNMVTSNDRSLILAQALDVQGRLQLAQGQAYPALTSWQQATDIYAQLGDTLGVTKSRINSAQALQALGLYRQAQKTLTESTQLLQREPDSRLKATGLRSLGNVLRVVGDLEQSRQILQQSLSVATRWSRLSVPPLSLSQSNQALGDTLLSLGNTARSQQDMQAAFKYYQQAATASASHSTRITAQLNQLSILLENRQLSRARALTSRIQPTIADLPPSRKAVYARINFAQSLIQLKQSGTDSTRSWSEIGALLASAVQQAKSIKDPRAEAYALGHLGGLYEQTQQWSSAQDLTQQALILASAINASDISYRSSWQLGRLLKAQGQTREAIAAVSVTNYY